MPRRKKKEKINIKSSETKIFFGLLLFVLGIALIIAPFVGEQAEIFIYLSNLLGWPSIVWGLAISAISLNLLTQGKNFNKLGQHFGFFILSLSLNTLLTFWIPNESLNDPQVLQKAGGTLGKILHIAINETMGDILELIILLIALIVAFSLITGIELKQITELFRQLFTNIDLGDLKNNLSEKEDSKKLVISGLGEDEDSLNKEDDNPIQFQDNNLNQVHTGVLPSMNNNIQPNTGISGLPKEDLSSTPAEPRYPNWVYPTIDNLQEPQRRAQDQKIYKDEALVIENVLRKFGIPAKVANIAVGPTVVRYALSIPVGVAVNKVKRQSNDIEVALKVDKGTMRIETPIPGTSYIGIEIKNKIPNYVYMKEMAKRLLSEADKYQLPLILGKDIAGKPEIRDLVNMPHLLVAGSTRSGKSVGINSILGGLLLTKTPDELQLILIDPKIIEMEPYNGIPHLRTPVINDMELVVNALQWAIEEMMKRYRLLKQVMVRNIVEYNTKVGHASMPYLVIVIDEMADLMLVAGPDTESKIQRLAQMGRAVGVHLIIATQKPVVTVITGLIKSNVPGRIAYAVPSAMDSRVILDQTGAENLIGSGDMLFKDQTMPKPIRIQGCYISTEDTVDIINQIKSQKVEGDVEPLSDITKGPENGGIGSGVGDVRDPEFPRALQVVIGEGKASASLLQRRLNIGYNKAARLMEQLEKAGAIGHQDGVKPRDILVSSASDILGDSDDDFTKDF
ncbi:MAG: cell division protein FtsK, DNA segregation ATPase FtsK/SpoIIIE, S-DNA-T family [candidate division WS6 bacterium GW2011_GWC1_33_20]|uniref:Cell division FtsK/SpoIIIE n=2 Tax=Candidatus Dojkabacteria TaxID=74243 RepID=A0A0G0AEV6_9BACT|nr:MAG: cell division protein FtsK, DNA segregation ATPase FtsK/SpoIIIE, S-DNA-T family [candidate division WS6 bacterium GW2011_GWE2_33_157]KKP44033.1 MAG: cell division protein FtsK, DNA segregation ATPase FtsK/SpoIIIE, S-DNA-T family [candidate division WS6 bacterium GW2011_GWC1_33_20]KKP44257.1 MAG: cell division protein FtsK, DNA segregation ATPase FtsK/SpoIIIE, S-DNA-T family [candidate division WS6 bacterium GW2011_GWF1_33_233]KKP54608.1 MAG: cell division protein FtsK, DNA segregation AT